MHIHIKSAKNEEIKMEICLRMFSDKERKKKKKPS